MAQSRRRVFTVLIAEDDDIQCDSIYQQLDERGHRVVKANSVEGTLQAADAHKNAFDIAIVDLNLPEDDRGKSVLGGGLILAEGLRQRMPKVRIFGISAISDPVIPSPRFAGFVKKSDIFQRENPNFLAEFIESWPARGRRRPPKTFIVHGHDSGTVSQLKNYLQNRLKLEEPIVLGERASSGRTIIEKFEAEARGADLVFVLLTPDDAAHAMSKPDLELRRARQNVIFEMGYFYAKLQRTSGKVILLYRGEVELPSDISGIIHINISCGIEAAGEEIRRELRAFLSD